MSVKASSTQHSGRYDPYEKTPKVSDFVRKNPQEIIDFVQAMITRFANNGADRKTIQTEVTELMNERLPQLKDHDKVTRDIVKSVLIGIGTRT